MPNLRRCEWNKSHVEKRVDLYQTGQPEADLTCYCLKNKWERTSKIVGKQGWVHTAPSFTIYVFYSVVDGAHNAQRETKRTFQTVVIKTLPRVEANWKEKKKKKAQMQKMSWMAVSIHRASCVWRRDWVQGRGSACWVHTAGTGAVSVGRGMWEEARLGIYSMIWFHDLKVMHSFHPFDQFQSRSLKSWSRCCLPQAELCTKAVVQRVTSKGTMCCYVRAEFLQLLSCNLVCLKGPERHHCIRRDTALRSQHEICLLSVGWDCWCCVWVVWCYSI